MLNFLFILLNEQAWNPIWSILYWIYYIKLLLEVWFQGSKSVEQNKDKDESPDEFTPASADDEILLGDDTSLCTSKLLQGKLGVNSKGSELLIST